MTRAYNTATTQQNSGGAVAGVTAGKNAVLNSAFNVWQRGTSVSGAGGGAYTADRWFLFAGGQITTSRQATNDTTNLPNIQYCARVQRTNGSTDTTGYSLSQSFETVNSIQYAGKTVTWSFYARRGANFSAASNNLVLYLVTGTGTDQNQQSAGYTGQALSINGLTATLTTTWQRFTYTATIPTNATEVSFSFVHNPVGTAGAADYFEVTGVQLEVGSVATPYAPYSATYQGELAACQRYYYRSGGAAGGGGYAGTGMGVALSTTSIRAWHALPVIMRTAASISRGGNMTFWPSGLLSTAIGGGYSSQIANGVMIDWTVTAATTDRAYVLYFENSANNFLEFSAEL